MELKKIEVGTRNGAERWYNDTNHCYFKNFKLQKAINEKTFYFKHQSVKKSKTNGFTEDGCTAL